MRKSQQLRPAILAGSPWKRLACVHPSNAAHILAAFRTPRRELGSATHGGVRFRGRAILVVCHISGWGLSSLRRCSGMVGGHEFGVRWKCGRQHYALGNRRGRKSFKESGAVKLTASRRERGILLGIIPCNKDK